MRRGQQETILAAVCTLRTHPTADEIYDKLRKAHPKLSLGTVYRNLGALAQKGDILRISVPDGADRFDFRLDKHEHMICERCGRAYDVDVDVKIDFREPKAELTGYDLVLRGVCEKCM